MEEKDKNIETTEETVESLSTEVSEESAEVTETVPAAQEENTEVTETVPDTQEENAENAELGSEGAEEILTILDDAPECVTVGDQPQKRQRKKWSKKKIALFVVVGFILLLAIAFGVFMLVGYLTRKDHDIKNRNFSGSAPAHLENTISEEDRVSLQAAVALSMGKDSSELTAEELATIEERIAYLYNLANTNKIHNTDQAIAILQGDGGAALGTVVGNMFVRGFKIQSGDTYYYQKAAMIYKCSIYSLQNTLEGLLNQQERAYADQENDVYRLTGTLKGSEANITNKDEIDYLPFIEVDAPDTVQTTDKAGFYSVGYYLDDPREIQNLRVTAADIVLGEKNLQNLTREQEQIDYLRNEKGDAEAADALANKPKYYLEYVDDTEFGMGYYVCRFSLNYTSDSCVDKARAYLRESANSDDLEYAQYDVILEVWENGYLKRMYDDEQWAGQVNMPALGNPTTKSTSWYEISMFYSYDESLKALFDPAVVDKYDGEDWAARIIADYKKDIGLN